ncbi:GNAT family N-acetyltransferase [Pectobacterium colocasium]|uniref:GNAT family N-acetyltransferase n=1 Tax=Pectobacterium TaxID=122277 RepID=UPI003D723ADB
MVNLKKMSAGEFAAYRQCFILEYAQDLQDSRGYDAEKARAIATQSIDIALPQGPDTAKNTLWCIHTDNTELVIGYLWVVFNQQSAWVSDFFLLPAWRGLGLGKASLLEMEAAVAAVGINEIGLRVAVNNQSAKALYEKIGFQTTGFNMNKILNSGRQK